MAYRKKIIQPDKRRIGFDLKSSASDIHMYRWFSCFLLVAKELEKKKVSFEIKGKKYPVKINRKHGWFQKINVDKLPNISLIQFNKKGLSVKIKKYFDGYFWRTYRDLFQERTVEVINDNSIKATDKNYHYLKMPKNLSIKRMKYLLDEVARRNEWTTYRGNSAEILIQSSKVMETKLNRLFHLLRLSLSKKEFKKLYKKEPTTFDIFNHYNHQTYKRPLIKIEKASLDRFEKGDKRRSKSSRTNVGDYDSQIRSTFRDIKEARIVLLNVCSGDFPNDKSISAKS